MGDKPYIHGRTEADISHLPRDGDLEEVHKPTVVAPSIALPQSNCDRGAPRGWTKKKPAGADMTPEMYPAATAATKRKTSHVAIGQYASGLQIFRSGGFV
ncbi:MAG: hypothetical protein ACXVVK_19320 [Solirubrobacteraceae bacterium]